MPMAPQDLICIPITSHQFMPATVTGMFGLFLQLDIALQPILSARLY